MTMLVFLVMGLGLAAPYALFAAVPALGRLAPPPGRWMDVLRQGLAFPMYGASAWLVWVVSQEAGPAGVLGTVAGLVLLGLRRLGAAAWRSRQTRADAPRSPSRSPAAALLVALAVLSGIGGVAGRRRRPARPGAEAYLRHAPGRAARRGTAGVRQHDRGVVRHLPGERAGGDRQRAGARTRSPRIMSPI